MDSSRAGKILVVDDIPENVRLLEAVLVPRGYEVPAATSGKEALDLVASVEPDLVLLDVVMPGMDGYAVCQALRDDEETAVLPVIMVTSSIGQEKTKAIESGADDFIHKPFNHHELLTRGSAGDDGAQRDAFDGAFEQKVLLIDHFFGHR